MTELPPLPEDAPAGWREDRERHQALLTALHIVADAIEAPPNLEGILNTLRTIRECAEIGAAEQSLGAAVGLLRRAVDETDAKNHVEMTFAFGEGFRLPFNRGSVVFVREGGMTPVEMVKAAKAKMARAQAQIDIV